MRRLDDAADAGSDPPAGRLLAAARPPPRPPRPAAARPAPRPPRRAAAPAPHARRLPPAPRPRRPSRSRTSSSRRSRSRRRSATSIAWTNSDTAPHSATMDNGACDTKPIAVGVDGHARLHGAGHVHLPLLGPPDADEGLHDPGPVGPGNGAGRRLAARAGSPIARLAQSGRLDDVEEGRARQEVDRGRRREAGARVELEEARARVASGCPGRARRSGCPRAARAWSDWSAGSSGRHQSRTTSRPPGATAAHDARSDPTGSRSSCSASWR